jgi:hypothetical protein
MRYFRTPVSSGSPAAGGAFLTFPGVGGSANNPSSPGGQVASGGYQALGGGSYPGTTASSLANGGGGGGGWYGGGAGGDSAGSHSSGGGGGCSYVVPSPSPVTYGGGVYVPLGAGSGNPGSGGSFSKGVSAVGGAVEVLCISSSPLVNTCRADASLPVSVGVGSGAIALPTTLTTTTFLLDSATYVCPPTFYFGCSATLTLWGGGGAQGGQSKGGMEACFQSLC